MYERTSTYKEEYGENVIINKVKLDMPVLV
jgi:hypothetical protein